MDLTIRTATEADRAAIAEVARACGQTGDDSGEDPAYVGHLLRHGQVAVAATPEATIGFAATRPVGGTTMLADLFVRPDRRSGGAGAALLAQVLAEPGPRMTFASHDARAIALYTRAGMSARWALLYLRGDPRRLRAGRPAALLTPADPGEAGRWERSWHGTDRVADYRHWAARGRTVLSGPPDRPVAVAAVTPDAIVHAAVAPGADADDAVLDLVAATATDSCQLCLPSTHPALNSLLHNGFVIDDFDLFMTSGDDIPGGPSGVYSSGLA